MKSKSEKYFYELISFILCTISFFLFIYVSYIVQNEGTTWVTGDMLELYIPAAKELVRSIYDGDSIQYSWNHLLGMDTIAYLTTWVGGSVCNILFFLFPNADISVVVLIYMMIKVGLAGFTFTIFARRSLQVDGKIALFGSIFYAMCGFQVAINSVNYIWMDGLYLLPLIVMLVKNYWEHQKWMALIICYSYLFITNYYIGYMVGIFSALFTFFYLICREKEQKAPFLKKGVLFSALVISAAGMVAFALIPTAYFVLFKMPADASTGNELTLAISKLLSQFMIGNKWQSDAVVPYLYCGVLFIYLVLGFVLQKRISIKKRVMWTGLLGIMVISCFSRTLYSFWHGFDAPDGWYYRFAFIICFLVVTMSCLQLDALRKLQAEEKKQEIYKLIFEIVIVTACIFLTMLPNNSMNCFINLAFILSWIILGSIWFLGKEKTRNVIYKVALFLAIVEVVTNGYMQQNIDESRDAQLVWLLESEAAMQPMIQDESFYRVNYENTLVMNAATYLGYKGVSEFGTFENYKVRKALESLGAYTSTRACLSRGLNPFTQAMLNVKYLIRGSGSNQMEEQNAQIYKYPRYLSLGYMVEKEVVNCDLSSNDVFQNCNTLASAMTGEEIDIFSPIPEEKITIVEEGVSVSKEEGYYLLRNTLDNDEVGKIFYQVPNEGKQAYFSFDCISKGIREDRARIYQPLQTRDTGYLGVNYSAPMVSLGEMQEAIVIMRHGVTRDEDNYQNMYAYYLEEDQLQSWYQELADSQMSVNSYGNNYVEGTIDVEDSSRILFTSIPYDIGWKVSSEQGDVEIVPVLDGAFLGISFPHSGEYDLHFKYQAPGLRIGIIVSVVSWSIFICLCVLTVRRRKLENITEKIESSEKNYAKGDSEESIQ